MNWTNLMENDLDGLLFNLVTEYVRRAGRDIYFSQRKSITDEIKKNIVSLAEQAVHGERFRYR